MSIQQTKYRGFRVTKGDATGEQLSILVPTGYRVLHFASAADENTDWAVANPTHPTWYVHSETTPATDYIRLLHDGTTGTIDAVGGTLSLNGVTTLNLQVGGTTVIAVSAAGPSFGAGVDLTFTGTTGTNDIVLTNALADALSITDGAADIIVIDTSTAGNVITITGAVRGDAAITSSGATAGIGYATGAGGTVTQITSKATGVGINAVTGIITMNGAALAADTTVSFTLTNTAIVATDAVIVLHESVGTLGAYSFASTAAAGSAVIAVHNNTPGSLSEAIVLRFVVIKSVNA